MKLLRLFTRAALPAAAPLATEPAAGAASTVPSAANEPWPHEPRQPDVNPAQGRAPAGGAEPGLVGAGHADGLGSEGSVAAEFAPPRPGLRTAGLLNAPELAAYFSTNHHASGRYHGCRYRSEQAREQGLAALVATFQNTVSEMAERRLARIDRLRLSRHDVSGLGEDLGLKLDLACAHALREVDALREQHDLAARRQGWVLDALNRYRLGFDRGVREAVDFELLSA